MRIAEFSTTVWRLPIVRQTLRGHLGILDHSAIRNPQSEMRSGRRQKAEGRGNGDKGKEVFADLLGLRPSVPWSLEHWERGWTGLPVDLPAVADPDQVDDLLL